MKTFNKLLKQLVFRNNYCRNGKRAQNKVVNLEYYDSEINLGDTLSPVICNWILAEKELSFEHKTTHTYHLMALGSILGGNGFFDAIVWGSGIKSFDQISALSKRRYFQKFDFRLIRGPLTRDALIGCGYKCPEKYGDPAVIMPYIYKSSVLKKHEYGVIFHFKQNYLFPDNVNVIDICTDDYKSFIDEICSCNKIISSSLHGIILAETYGIPAVFLGLGRECEMLKYYDWYFSTGRKNVKIAFSLREAIDMKPMDLPNLSDMQKTVIETFPYDLWAQ